MRSGYLRTGDGCLLAYEDTGEGIPVLWQHGLGAERTQPADVFPELQQVRRITLECRGHGLSELGGEDKLSIAQFELDVCELLDHLEVRSAVIGGISLGAAIAARFATRHPDRVSALILARPAWVEGPSLETMAPYGEVAHLLREHGGAAGEIAFQRSTIYERIASLSPDNASSLSSFFQAKDKHATIALLSSIPMDSPGLTRAALSGIRCPTLILANDHDFVHPLLYAERLNSLILSSRLQIITSKSVNKGAHFAEFKAAIAAFLTSLGASLE